MRSEESPLDLNNLPEDYTRDVGGAAGVAVYRAARKKSCGGGGGGAKGKEDETGKVYECRFCSLKFCKSQALGGHMNRHRQERETETLNKARQLVFTTDLAPAHIGYVSGGQPITHGGGYHQAGGGGGDPSLTFRSMYPPPTTRLFSSSSPLIPQPPPPPPQPQAGQPYMYASPPHLLSFHPQYPPPANNDYYVGHVLSSNPSSCYGSGGGGAAAATANEGNYTCIGAPVGHGFANGGGGGGDVSLHMNQEEGQMNWGRR
ncbi:hypothetical protein ACP275_12G078500 [Erythranthe tilingii]